MTTIQKIVNDKIFIRVKTIVKMNMAHVPENDNIFKKQKMEVYRLRLLKDILDNFYA